MDLNDQFNEAIRALLEDGYSAATPKFKALVEGRLGEMSPKGKHGAVALYMACLVEGGDMPGAIALGAKLHAAQPDTFISLAQLSPVEGASERVAKLRESLKLLTLRTSRGDSLFFIYNSSNEPVVIGENKFDVSFGFSSKSSSVGNLTTSGSPAFPGAPIELGKQAGLIIKSGEIGGGLIPLPDVVTIVTFAAQQLRSDWIHLVFSEYSQTVTKLDITATVRWGKEELKEVPLVRLVGPPPTKEEQEGAPGGEGR